MKSVTTEFKSGGLHEKHVVATWRMYFVCWINQSYRHTLRIYNTYGFSATTMALRKRLSITFIGRLPVKFTFILMMEDNNIVEVAMCVEYGCQCSVRQPKE